MSEWICDLAGRPYPESQVYCITANGAFPAASPWPEYYHSAYPAEYQNSQEWLPLKGAYSNSLWFPVPAVIWLEIAALLPITWVPKVGGCREDTLGEVLDDRRDPQRGRRVPEDMPRTWGMPQTDIGCIDLGVSKESARDEDRAREDR